MTARLPFAARRDPCELVAPEPSERPSDVALDLCLRLVVGADDAAMRAWLRSAMLRWIRSDGSEPLSACLHLGASPRRVRLALRDRWLHEAARYVGGSPWAQAKALAREADHFERFRWPTWRKAESLPLDVGTPVEVALHGARMCERLPKSPEAYLAILRNH